MCCQFLSHDLLSLSLSGHLCPYVAYPDQMSITFDVPLQHTIPWHMSRSYLFYMLCYAFFHFPPTSCSCYCPARPRPSKSFREIPSVSLPILHYHTPIYIPCIISYDLIIPFHSSYSPILLFLLVSFKTSPTCSFTSSSPTVEQDGPLSPLSRSPLLAPTLHSRRT